MGKLRILFTALAGLVALSVAHAQSGKPAVVTGIPQWMSRGSAVPMEVDEPAVRRGFAVAIGGELDDIAVSCVQCHGLRGAGDGSGAFPRLADQSAWYLYKTLQDYAAGRRANAIMTPIAQGLAPAQREAVAAYYSQLEGVPYPAPPVVDPNLLQIGGAISARGVPERGVQPCTNCHGENGLGWPPSYPYLAGQYADYLQLQLQLWKRGERGGDPLDVMRHIAQQLTDEQIRAVSLYFANIRPREVTPPPAEAGSRAR